MHIVHFDENMLIGDAAADLDAFMEMYGVEAISKEYLSLLGKRKLNLLKEVVNMWWSIGGGIIIFALGMFIFLKPGLIWKLTEEWKSYRADEPSEFYLKTTKIGGILFALFGIIMIMLPVILE